LKRFLKAAVGNAVVSAGAGLSDVGRRLLLSLQAHDRPGLPIPLEVNGRTFDVVGDLAAYTTLRPDEVQTLLQRRNDSFRVEWHTLQPKPQNETWFYLSSRTYLFGNAIHFHEDPATLDAIVSLRPPPARVLDFGAGSGNLALALAATGLQTDAIELSAIQKDFIRFRATRHALDVNVLDWWDDDALGSYDLIFAFDVLEHLPDLRRTLEERLLPALLPGGLLAERSPFIRNFSNPMHHHDDEGLDSVLRANGLELVEDTEPFRVWQKSPGQAESSSA
jgi:SAM-dependent methyltransferase